MRKILRRIAHARMREAGFRKVNKRGMNGKSFFAGHWREFA